MTDIRDQIFLGIADRLFHADLTAERDGVLSGVCAAQTRAEQMGIELKFYAAEGDKLIRGKAFAELAATPKKMTMAEDTIIGLLAKYSGVATAAARAVRLADGKLRVVSGSSKKMPPEIKSGIRQAIHTGGADTCISPVPMVYLDKNYIRMLGSIRAALEAVQDMRDRVKVVQVKGTMGSIEAEVEEAAANGCGVVMVDTGRIGDAVCGSQTLARLHMRKDVRIAFAGGIRLADIPAIVTQDIDMLCIGREIVDAPLLDMRLDVRV